MEAGGILGPYWDLGLGGIRGSLDSSCLGVLGWEHQVLGVVKSWLLW